MSGDNYVRKIVSRIIRKLVLAAGFLPEEIFWEEREGISLSIRELWDEVHELSNTVSDYDKVFADCVHANHRLKKLEQYLGIEYVVEQPDVYIGYKKVEDKGKETNA